MKKHIVLIEDEAGIRERLAGKQLVDHFGFLKA